MRDAQKKCAPGYRFGSTHTSDNIHNETIMYIIY